MTERSRGLPSPEQVLELLNGEFGRSGYEVEDVAIDLQAIAIFTGSVKDRRHAA